MANEQNILNYRLSRARCTVGNAFDIVANRFAALPTTSPNNQIQLLALFWPASAFITWWERGTCSSECCLRSGKWEPQNDPVYWRDSANLDDMEQIRDGNYSTRVAKQSSKEYWHLGTIRTLALQWRTRFFRRSGWTFLLLRIQFILESWLTQVEARPRWCGITVEKRIKSQEAVLNGQNYWKSNKDPRDGPWYAVYTLNLRMWYLRPQQFKDLEKVLNVFCRAVQSLILVSCGSAARGLLGLHNLKAEICKR